MQLHVVEGLVLVAMCALVEVTKPHPQESLTETIIEGIGNVALTATDILTGIVRRPKEVLHRVTDTATDYINSAVEVPRNLLINATRTTTGYIDSAASRGLEFKLRRFLEKFRARMRHGIPDLGIPILEPFHLDELDIAIDNAEIGKVTGVIEDLLVHQLSTFVIKRAKLSLIGPTISVNVSVPRIDSTGYYNVSGILGDMFRIYGAGPFQATIYDFRLYVNTVLGYSAGMYLKSFELDFSLGSMNVQLQNFMGDEEIGDVMSRVFQELTPEVLDIIKPDVLPGIQDYVVGRVNETIHHLTMRDIFNVLLGQNEIRDFAHLLIPSG